ncbi:MAG TPA: hypothetical protein PLF40_31175 [Kofleriaceae bacterium]|nr:hypothetical protein [Kofleriaceae bacterium]
MSVGLQPQTDVAVGSADLPTYAKVAQQSVIHAQKIFAAALRQLAD